jgi:hypothetical protein
MLTWVVPTPDQQDGTADVLFKFSQAIEKALFDFGNFDELEPDAAGLTGTPTVTASPLGLTITNPNINANGYQVGATISGGPSGTTYTLTISATESLSGNTLYGQATLTVR